MLSLASERFSFCVLALRPEKQVQLFTALLTSLKEKLPWRVDRPGSSFSSLDFYCIVLGCSIRLSSVESSFASTHQLGVVPPTDWSIVLPGPDSFCTRLRGCSSQDWRNICNDVIAFLPQEKLFAFLPALFHPIYDPLPPLPEYADELLPTLTRGDSNENGLAFLEIHFPVGKAPQRLSSKTEIFLALQEMPLDLLFRVVAFFLGTAFREEVYRIQIATDTPLFLSSYRFFGGAGLPLPEFFLPIQSGKLLLPQSKEIKRVEQAQHLHDDTLPLLAFLEPMQIKEKA